MAAGIVANARHADRADMAARALEADRVQGRTAVQIAAAGAQAGAQLPGPASTAAALVTQKTQPGGTLAPQTVATYTVSCETGSRVVGGGFSSTGGVESLGSYPSGPATWTLRLDNAAAAPADVQLYATCLR